MPSFDWVRNTLLTLFYYTPGGKKHQVQFEMSNIVDKRIGMM